MKTQKGKSNIFPKVFGVLMESECELVVKAKDSEKKRVTLALVIFLMQGHHLAVSLLVRPPFLFLATLNSEYYV